MEIDETFRNNLKRLREEKGMNAKQLSIVAKLGERNVKDIEEGRSQSPKLSTAYKLAKALDADLSEMMGLGPAIKVAQEVQDFLAKYDEDEQRQLVAALAAIPRQPA